VKALLDTHAVVWAAEGDARLGPAAVELLRNLRAGEAVVSGITLLEIAMLAKKDRIRLSVPAEEYLCGIQRNFPPLPITSEIASIAMELELPQADPFDRVIVATAKHHNLPLLTRDQNITACGIIRIVW
jgi:PIN domain nuclease of toxin-antitoxin system